MPRVGDADAGEGGVEEGRVEGDAVVERVCAVLD